MSGGAVTDAVQASLNETVELLQRATGAPEGFAMAFDPDVLLPTQFSSTAPIDPERALAACRNEQQDVDVMKFRDLASAVSPVGVLSVDTDPACRTSIRWQELNLPRGRRHELRAVMVDSRGVCWGAVALYRHTRRGFSGSDLQKVASVLPQRASHLARSMTSSRAPGTPSEATTLVLNDTGELLGAPDRARRWLARMRQQDALDRVAMLLASVAARIRNAETRDPECPAVRVRMPSAGGSWTTLLAEPLTIDGAARGISVVIMGTEPAQLFPLLVAAYGLSGREVDVVRQVLDGLDTKAIAERLCISVNTVQDHLKSVFDKTGVRSRRELAFVFTREPETT